MPQSGSLCEIVFSQLSLSETTFTTSGTWAAPGFCRWGNVGGKDHGIGGKGNLRGSNASLSISMSASKAKAYSTHTVKNLISWHPNGSFSYAPTLEKYWSCLCPLRTPSQERVHGVEFLRRMQAASPFPPVRGLRSNVSFPSVVWGGAPVELKFGAF